MNDTLHEDNVIISPDLPSRTCKRGIQDKADRNSNPSSPAESLTIE